MKKLHFALALGLLASMLGGGFASAHVVVLPKETTQGSYEKFAVRVPTEKDIPTVKIEVKFPLDAVSISSFEPKPGWKYELTKDANNKITGVVWIATGDGLGAKEFGEFYMQGKVADTATTITWKAYQTYKDGSVVEWVGADGADKPASVTKVKEKPAGTGTDSHGHTTAPAAPAANKAASEAPAASQTPLYLSIAGVVLGAAALIVSLMRRKA
ncbi:Uncharacterized protein YcnI [Paenibacillus tianmuensis]|uniref:Uncharacterized protein YcnI n=1 Tax=Paenibacillus tianmuensis TaxID=624147 RepID=A0A1G4QQM9_9BACL|nr:YcnI family protein [Paenibacillus tianmuensis]SCW46920.1 Uncharacterized protein YcnI [Paenibacillus tianmuensis]